MDKIWKDEPTVSMDLEWNTKVGVAGQQKVKQHLGEDKYYPSGNPT